MISYGKTWVVKAFFCSVLLGAVALESADAGQTPWAESDVGSSARLVLASAGKANDDGLLAGIEIKLPPEWKTYWRSPGEAGLPTTVRLGGQQLDILFPLPKPIVFYGIKTFGYSDLVMLPFRLAPSALENGDTLTLDYMVCKDICVPIVATFTVGPDMLDESSPLADIAFDSWLKKVPNRSGGAYGMAIKSADIVGRVGYQRVVVDAAVADRQEEILFVVEADGFQMQDLQRRVLADGSGFRYIAKMVTQDDKADLKARDLRITLAKTPVEAIDQIILMENQAVGR